jgi:hypothetical protein
MQEGANPVFLTSARLTQVLKVFVLQETATLTKPLQTCFIDHQPWAFPDHFPQQWLQFVNLQNCSYTLEVRDTATGGVLTQYALDVDSLFNSSRLEVAALSLTNADENRFRADQAGEMGLVAAQLSPKPLEATHHFGGPSRALFTAVGHDVDAEDGSSSSSSVLKLHTQRRCRFLATKDKESRGLLMTPFKISPGYNGGGVYLDTKESDPEEEEEANQEIGGGGEQAIYAMEKRAEEERAQHISAQDGCGLCFGIVEGEVVEKEMTADMADDPENGSCVSVASSTAIRAWLSGEEEEEEGGQGQEAGRPTESHLVDGAEASSDGGAEGDSAKSSEHGEGGNAESDEDELVKEQLARLESLMKSRGK